MLVEGHTSFQLTQHLVLYLGRKQKTVEKWQSAGFLAMEVFVGILALNLKNALPVTFGTIHENSGKAIRHTEGQKIHPELWQH